MGFARDNRDEKGPVEIVPSSRYNVARRESMPLNPEIRICDNEVTEQRIEGDLELHEG